MKKSILLIFLLSNLFMLDAQNRYSSCYFGTVGIDFRYNPPTVIGNSGMDGRESPASICDEEGNVLFYSNGGTSELAPGFPGGIWNRNNVLMENGILGDSSGCFSAARGAVALKAPDNELKVNSNLYYLFTRDCLESTFANPTYYNSGLTYSLVDMNENSGLGKVISKNNIVVPYSTGGGHSTAHEPLAAVQHANNNDYWIFSYNNDSLYSVLLTPDGVSNYRSYDLARGYIIISPARNKLKAGRKFYDFNAETGDLVYIDSLLTGNYAFSPDGTKLYLTRIDPSINQSALYRYNLEDPNFTETYEIIEHLSQSYTLFLAPDHQIYLHLLNANRFVGRIRCPNHVNYDFSMTPLPFINPNLSTGTNTTNIPANFLFWEGASCTASVEENESEINLATLFPNPNDGKFTIQFPEQDLGGTLVIKTVSGRTVLSKPVEMTKMEINEASFSPGVYFITWVKDSELKQILKMILH